MKLLDYQQRWPEPVNNTRYVSQCGTTTGALTCTLNNVPSNNTATWGIAGYAGNCDSNSLKDNGPSETINPLAVTLAEFHAAQQGDAVLVTWETVSKLNNRGFNLYRGTLPDGPDRQLNATLIPSQSQGSPGGFTYTWEDAVDLVPGTSYFYWLDDVDLDGAVTRHGPVSVDYVGPTAVTLDGVNANPAAALPALPWLAVTLAAGAALALGRRRSAE